jgi:hypothetical protein
MPPENRKQFEFTAFWNEWRNLKDVYTRTGKLEDFQRRSLADVAQWAATQGLESIIGEILQILDATEVVEVDKSGGVKFTAASDNEYRLIAELVTECIESRPYEMSASEAKRFIEIHNAKSALKVKWNENIRPVISTKTVQIKKIEKITNDDLEEEFEAYVNGTDNNNLASVTFIAPKARVKVQNALAKGKGHFLFHGTSVLGVQGIGKNGFDPKRCNVTHDLFGDRYGSLGQGAYLSDNFAKCAAYARCDRCEAVACPCDSLRPVLVCLVRYTSKDGVKDWKTYGRRYRSVEELLQKQQEKGQATTVARGNSDRNFFSKALDLEFGNNDFLVYRRDMALPVYVVWYRRKAN